MRTKITMFLALLLLLGIPNIYAQMATAQYNMEGKSDFSYVGAQGGKDIKNPGFIELKGVSTTANTAYTYFLWVSEDGKLRLASYATLSPYASFPNGTWERNTMPVGTVVGGQS